MPKEAARLKQLTELGERVATLLNPNEDAAKDITKTLGPEARMLGVLTRSEAGRWRSSTGCRT